MAGFILRPKDKDRKGMTATADDLGSAINAGWQLQRHYEAPIEIVDDSDGEDKGRVLGIINLEWLDD